jgi:hypothetical protein
MADFFLVKFTEGKNISIAVIVRVRRMVIGYSSSCPRTLYEGVRENGLIVPLIIYVGAHGGTVG